MSDEETRLNPDTQIADNESVPPDDHQDSSAEEKHGRVGYGGYARYSPALLAILIVAVVVYIGWDQRQTSNDVLPRPGTLIDQPAPDFNLTLLDGGSIALSDYDGYAVALNFWGSWCAPCRAEMPDLQAVASRLERDGVLAAVIGVGIKNDNDQNAHDFVDELGITYPVGRDTEGDNPVLGPIERAYGVTTYPTTVFIRPDGTVFAVRIGEVTAEEVEEYLEATLA